MAKKDDLKKYSRSELLELLIEQGRRIERLEAELDAACRALAERDAARNDSPEASAPLPKDVRDAARKNARTLLFDVMALMGTLEDTEAQDE